MSNSLESQVLKTLGVRDFRHVRKDLVCELFTNANSTNSEVIIKGLEQFPALAKAAETIFGKLADAASSLTSADDETWAQADALTERTHEAARTIAMNPGSTSEERITALEVLNSADARNHHSAETRSRNKNDAIKTVAGVAICIVGGMVLTIRGGGFRILKAA